MSTNFRRLVENTRTEWSDSVPAARWTRKVKMTTGTARQMPEKAKTLPINVPYQKVAVIATV